MSNNGNLFQRAKNIRIKGESWKNCIQRAKAQIKYEGQLGGNLKNNLKKSKKFNFNPSKHTLAGGYFKQSDNISNTSSTRTSDFTHVSDTTSYTVTGGGYDNFNSSSGSVSSSKLLGGSDMSYTSDDNVSVSSVW